MPRLRSSALRAAPLALLAACAAPPGSAGPSPEAYGADARAADSAAALETFRSNIRAIHQRDRTAYLTHYLRSERLARTGPGGVQWGYAGMTEGDPDAWPDTLVATHFSVVPVAPGVVYGAYRYRVVDGGTSSRGVSERVLVKQPDGTWRVAVTTAFGSPGDRPAPAYALVGGTVIDGTGAAPMDGATVVMRDGRIECVGACEVADDVETIDARGRWIVPGLVDAHVHFAQSGWADARPDARDLRDRFPYDRTIAELEAHPERFFRSHLCNGVTAVFDVGGYPWTWTLPERTEESTSAPHVAAAGPLLSARDHTVDLPGERQFVYMADEEATREGARWLVRRGADAVKVWYLVDERGDTTAFKARLRAGAAEAREAGVPLIVHATNLWAAKDALRAGARVLVHSVEDRPVDDEFLRLAQQAGAFYVPTLTVPDGYVQLYAGRWDDSGVPLACLDPETLRKARLTDGLEPAMDAGALAGMRSRVASVRETAGENLRRVHAAGIPVAMGTDAGNPLTLHGSSVPNEMEAMAAAGLSPMDVLVASTRDAARAMGRGDDFGTLEPGRIADLVVLGADPLADVGNVRAVRLVVRNGEPWTREELEFGQD